MYVRSLFFSPLPKLLKCPIHRQSFRAPVYAVRRRQNMITLTHVGFFYYLHTHFLLYSNTDINIAKKNKTRGSSDDPKVIR